MAKLSQAIATACETTARLIKEYVNTHANNKSNPHGVTAAQVGAAPAALVQKELKVASETELDTALTAEINAMKDNSARFLIVSPTDAELFGGVGMLCELYKRVSGYAVAKFTGYGQHTPGLSCKTMWSGAWQPLEYENPPMALGVEYRTTERWGGKPVYVKAVDCGELPNTSTKNVTLADGLTGENIVDWRVKLLSSTKSVHMLPWLNTSFVGQARAYISSTGQIQFTTNSDMSAYTAIVTVKFIKA